MWLVYALVFALTTSFSVLIAKRIMRDVDEYLYLALSSLFALPFLFLIVIYFYQIPQVDEIFIRSIIISSGIGVLGAIFAYRAIRISDVSLVSPISAFNPVFTAIVSFLILKEFLSSKDIMGILLVCAGAYLLELSRVRKSLFSPVRALVSHKGVQLSFIAYFIWAITPIFEKTAIMHTTPQVPPFVSLVGFSISSIIFSSLAKARSKIKFTDIKGFIPVFLAIGFLGGLGQTTAMLAFSVGSLGLVTSIFKLSIIFTTILGWVLFKEQNIKNRLLGSSVMILGVIFLVV